MSSNPAFAFVVNSLLNNNKNVKLLSKAKKDTAKVEEKQSDDNIALVDHDGKNVSQDIQVTQKKTKKTTPKLNRQELDAIGRVKAHSEDKEREQRLTMLATKGVVQLFNVVREQQRQIKNKLEEAGSSESKRLKSLSQFSESDLVAKVNKKTISQTKSSDSSDKKWKVLNENFMTGAKLKDWDRESNSDSE